MRIGITLLVLVCLFPVPGLFGQADDVLVLKKGGYFEIGGHYSSWNIDLLESTVTDLMIPDVEDYDEEQGEYSFDTWGENYGIEIRWFPGGLGGSFSVGLSYEWNYFNGALKGTFTNREENGDLVEGELEADFELLPHSMHLNLRWELWPRSRVHPYLGFGFGFGAMKGTIKATGTARTTHPDLTTEIDIIEEEYSLQEVLEEEEGGGLPISFFPVAQLQLGVRAAVLNRLFVTGEVAFYNGLAFRGGIAYRF